MLAIIHIVVIIFAIPIMSLGFSIPIIAAVNRKRWCPQEALLPAIFVVGAIGPVCAMFISNIMGWTLAPFVVLAIPVFFAWLNIGRECWDLIYNSRRELLHLALLYCTLILIQVASLSYEGAFWHLDWYNHFLYSTHFSPYFGSQLSDLSPGRGWLCSIFGSFFFPLWKEAPFAVFQVCISFLSLTGAAAIMGLCREYGPKVSLFAVAIFPFVPTFLRNSCYTWPKMYAAGCVLTYVLIRRKSSPWGRLFFAGLCGGCGVLSHFSSAAYLLAFEAWVLIRDLCHGRMSSIIAAGLSALGVLSIIAPYVGWLTIVFGPRQILGALVVSHDTSFSGYWQRAYLNSLYAIFPFSHEIRWIENVFFVVSGAGGFQYTLRIACDTFFGLFGILSWLCLGFSSIRRVNYRQIHRISQISGFGPIILGGLFCMALHQGIDEKGLMSVGLLPLAGVLFAFYCIVLSFETRSMQAILMATLLLYGIRIAGYHLMFLTEGEFKGDDYLIGQGLISLNKLIPSYSYLLAAIGALGVALINVFAAVGSSVTCDGVSRIKPYRKSGVSSVLFL